MVFERHYARRDVQKHVLRTTVCFLTSSVSYVFKTNDALCSLSYARGLFGAARQLHCIITQYSIVTFTDIRLTESLCRTPYQAVFKRQLKTFLFCDAFNIVHDDL